VVPAASVGARDGIPFEFAIPETALALSDHRATGEVRWTPEVRAPQPGLDYEALFGVVVRSPR
jgi:hypothetical protein